MKCLFVVNTLAGHYKKKVIDKKIEKMSKGLLDCTFSYLDENSSFPDIKGFKKVFVFGGDGTLNSILNAEKTLDQGIVYVPIGTLNETAKNSEDSLRHCLSVNGRNVAYVFATGIFTALGYNTKIKTKKRLKVLAYILNVLKEYRIARINASIRLTKLEDKVVSKKQSETVFGESSSDTSQNELSKEALEEYSLIMCIKSKSCFGFKFNKLENSSDEFAFLSIKAPKHDGLLGKIELFLPLFRSFFIGFKKEYSSKSITFERVSFVNLSIKEKTAFCLDGEKAVFENNIQITTRPIQEIKILKLNQMC